MKEHQPPLPERIDVNALLDALMTQAPVRAVPMLEGLKSDPSNAAQWLALAVILERNGYQGQSILAALQAHAQAPGDPKICLDVAYMLVWSRRDREALKLAERVEDLEAYDGCWATFEIETAVLVRRGDWKAAVLTCCAWAELDDRGSVRLSVLRLAERGHFREALFELAEEPSLGTTMDAALFEGLANALHAKGDLLFAAWALDEALLERDDFLLARRLDQWMEQQAHVTVDTLGVRCAPDALEHFRGKTTRKPDCVSAWVARALLAHDLKLLDEAKQAAEKALTLDLRCFQALGVLSLVCAARGAVDDAVKHLEIAAKVAPQPEWAYVELARLHHMRGDADELAVEACQNALRHNAGCWGALELLEAIYSAQDDTAGVASVLELKCAEETDDRILEVVYRRLEAAYQRLNKHEQAREARRMAHLCMDEPDFEAVEGFYFEDERLGASPPEPKVLLGWAVGLIVVVVAVLLLLKWYMSLL